MDIRHNFRTQVQVGGSAFIVERIHAPFDETALGFGGAIGGSGTGQGLDVGWFAWVFLVVVQRRRLG